MLPCWFVSTCVRAFVRACMYVRICILLFASLRGCDGVYFSKTFVKTQDLTMDIILCACPCERASMRTRASFVCVEWCVWVCGYCV